MDLHTHSVFSTGRVWPGLRVEEAQLAEPDALQEMRVQVLNAFTAPDAPIEVIIRRAAD